ncbi:unnamed protein product [Caenorhabditis angaria]|uniref:Phosphatidylinositol-glycan biosynthesis class W protein n=1 Tax=Caenorhabditis angaria TaxID=860376 RepID=A0A9P1I9K4_9PELO|nr:unnamed protein product [Caenorhabditis angaria]
MPDDPIEIDHSEFVGTKTGCSQREIFIVVFIGYLGILIRNSILPWIFLGRTYNTSWIAYWSKFLVDASFLVIPSFLAVTIFSNHLAVYLLVLIIIYGLLLGLVFFEASHHSFGPPIKQTWNSIVDEQHKTTMFVTYLRSGVMVLVAISILAVDFPVFPRKYAKTEYFGHSVMDLGVSVFICMSGLSSKMSQSRNNENIGSDQRKWYLSSTLFLFIIGMARTIFLEILDYPKHVSEYGVHWNFFFTLASVRIVYRILPKHFPYLTAILLGLFHQTILKSGYQDWILVEGQNNRDNLLSANAEGIVSLLGYLTLFYGSLAIGEFLSHTGFRVKSWIRRCLQLVFLAAIFYFLQAICEYFIDRPSRRVVNITYIFAQLSVFCFITMICLAAQMFNIVLWTASIPHFSNGDHPFSPISPCLTESINRHSLLFFILSNILTGLVNMSIPAHKTPDHLAIPIILAYVFIVSFVVHFIEFRKTVLKIHSE